MKLRSFFLILGTGAIALFLVTAGSLYWIITQSPLNLLGGGVEAYPQAAVFIPRQAPAMVSLLVNPEKLDALRQLSVPINQRRRSRQEWNEIKTNLLAKTGLDYQRDIKPWLGEEITLAITSLDVDRNPDNGVQPGYLLATATKDTELAKEFLQISFSEQAIASEIYLAFEQYKGVSIIYQRPRTSTANPSIWASAVVGNFVLFANQPQVLKEAINNAQAVSLNLDRASHYQAALKTIVQPRIGLAYVNLPGASAWLDQAPIPETPEVEQTLAVTLSAQKTGVIAETALIGVNGESDRIPGLSEPVKVLSYLPPDNIVTIAGKDLSGFWQQITAGLNPNSPLAQLVNQVVTSIETPLGINLAEDIFAWVKDEYGLSLVSQPGVNNFGWLFVAAATPETESEIDAAIAHLDDLARQQGLTVGEFTVDNTNITAWTKLKTAAQPNSITLNADVRGAHARREKYVFLASSLKAIATALNSGNNSFSASPEFKRIVTSLPAVNDGYVYVNLAEGKSIVESQLPIVKVIELAAQSLFSHLRAIALTSQGTENGVRHATILFDVSP